MAELRPKIVELAKMVGGLAGALNKIDENAPEYYALAGVVTDEMADVALTMGVRKERTLEYVAEKSGKTLDEARVVLDQLAYVGIIKEWTPPEVGEDRYLVPIFAPGILEMMVNNREQLAAHPEIGKAFEEYTRLRLGAMAALFPTGLAMMRVLPVESALEGIEGVKDWERISYYLDKYDVFSVSDCSCRQSRRVIGEGCGHLEKDMCIQMGSGADQYIRTGRGRQVTKEEVLQLLKFAETNGLMHEMPALDGAGETTAICNCCSCSCFSLRLAVYFNTPDSIRSNYRSEPDRSKCVACGQCVESCPTNALRLGQKLCAVEAAGAPAEEPTARDHLWSKAQWNEDYREDRQDVAEEGTSPCKASCPAHIAVQGYIKLAAEGRYEEALALIKKENPFPAVCGRICPHACESECTRGEIDDPIAIDEVKKFIADKELDEAINVIPPKRYNLGNKVAIIGAGPAGLSCAYYLAIDGYDITVFEREARPGGMLALGIPEFRLEKKVLDAEIDVLRTMGVKIQCGVDVGKDVTLDELRAQGYEAFYLAIGAQGGRSLGVEGEDAENVFSGVDFLRRVNLGQKVELPGRVLVIGGGNVAIDVARTATRCGATSTDLYCLESREEMPALEDEIAEAERDSVSFNNGWGPKRIVVKDGKVCGVEFKRCTAVFDADGRFNPTYDEADTITVDADAVLLSIGQSIEWGDLLEGSAVELGRGNTAKADSLTYQTAQPDVFVGGDCCTGPKFAIDAIAEGKEGAISIHRFVQPGQTLTLGRDRREYHSLDKSTVSIALTSFDNTPRQIPGHTKRKPGDAFADDRLTFTEEQLKKETERCLGCGAVELDEYKCIGCGLCTTKCAFDAIHLVRAYDTDPGTYEDLPIRIAANAIKRTGKIAATGVKETIERAQK